MNIDTLLSIAVEQGASDLHLSSGEVPMLRIDGDLQRIDHPVIQHELLDKSLKHLMTNIQLDQYEKMFQTDFSYSLGELSRFRVNAYNQFRGASAAFRAIPYEVPTFESLDMIDPVLQDICHYRNGLVLVTGPTGSGKSTTLAAMIDYLNTTANKHIHILTIEDPVEYLFKDGNCLIQQREVGNHTLDFNSALRAALREDPDVLMVGEMRDIETIRLAITAAETGHLVFATLHTSNASKSIYRIVDAFPPGEKDLIRAMLAESLRAVVAQVLLKRPDAGRIAAQEIMICTPAIRNMIRESKIAQIYSSIQTGSEYGMRSLEQHIDKLIEQEKIDHSIGLQFDQK